MQRFLQQIIFSFFLIGCVNPFAPTIDELDGSLSDLISDQKSVDGVLKNFKFAYTFRDTSLYGNTLANNFIFIYKDYDKGVDVFWGRDEEMRSTNGLFQSVQNIDLVWNNTLAENIDTLKASITKSFNLTVTFSPSDIIRIDGYASLMLEKNNINDQWKITRWRDESNY